MSGIRQYLTICTGQLVEFLGWELQSSGPRHIVFLIKIGPNNYLKVTNVDRNEPRGFYRNSKLTTFWEFRHFWSLFEPDFKINNFKNNMFRMNSIRAFDWCMNCHIYSVSCDLSAVPVGTGTGTDRNVPAPTDTKRHKIARDEFY